MKKLIVIIGTLLMLVARTVAIADNDDIKVMFEGKEIVFDVPPIIQDDVTLVPMRAIFEALGAEVIWDSNEQIITATMGNGIYYRNINMQIGDAYMTRYTGDTTQVIPTPGVVRIELDTSPIIVNERTLVPLRAVSEAFDYDVQWEEGTHTVTITAAPQPTTLPPIANEDTRTSILEGRLAVTAESGWEIDSDYYGHWLTFDKDGIYIHMNISEMGYKTTGDLARDVRYLGYKLAEKVIKQNGIEFVNVIEDNSDDIYRLRYIVISNDGYLIDVEFISNTKEISKKDLKENVKIIMNNLEDGGKKLDTSEKMVLLDNLNVKQPEGFVAKQEYGVDFEMWSINKIVTPDTEAVPAISIYCGRWPTYDEEYYGEKPTKTIEGEFIGNKIKWQLYRKNNYMQALYEDNEEGVYYHIAAVANNAEEQKKIIEIVSNIEENISAGVGGKPVIYLYPEQETEVNVKLDLKGEFTFTYPEYNEGWTVTAKPDGTIMSNGKQYSYLFWEGTMPDFKTDFKEGFVVKGSESAGFLRDVLEKMGLTPKEYNEFIVYWAPKLQKNAYNKIYFAQKEYEKHARLDINPKPDSILRVFMVYEKADGDTVLPEQKIKPFERKGFTVVEWGGYLTEK